MRNIEKKTPPALSPGGIDPATAGSFVQALACLVSAFLLAFGVPAQGNPHAAFGSLLVSNLQAMAPQMMALPKSLADPLPRLAISATLSP